MREFGQIDQGKRKYDREIDIDKKWTKLRKLWDKIKKLDKNIGRQKKGQN